ncbi:hypothetical protein JZK55_18320 [Dissulfurispira thermophila]|uniref:STAS domain-containing protein n=2 Tax=root TaxID=1 RepID=A0A7G1H2B2_9BACT|nr:hypothetical protein [Dissulfurispira thermophila]BCB96910.1 hypothetical protein JZK55_18320 [Dissulfurispira thermophila]
MEAIASGISEVTITGEIKSINDYLDIKKVITELIENNDVDSITIKIPTSASINSALIGFFLRLVHENKIKLTIHVGNDRLLNLLNIMNLMTIFNVQKKI